MIIDYLANSDYITPQQKAEIRQQAIEQGLLPREAEQGQQTTPAPPKGKAIYRSLKH